MAKAAFALPKDDELAYQMMLSGISEEQIKSHFKVRTVTQVRAAIKRAQERSHANVLSESEKSRRVKDLDRLESLHKVVWPKALKGEESAIDRALKIAELRHKVTADINRPATGLLQEFEVTVKNLGTGDIDRALIESGRQIARQIDFAIQHGTGEQITKALYLVPHMLNVLRELNATPAARKNLSSAVPKETVNDLVKFRAKHKAGAAG